MKHAASADAEVFFLPSYSESFGVSVVEAMAAGVPVIISDRVSIHREVAGAQVGLVIDCTAEQLKSALKTVTGQSSTSRTPWR